MNAMLWFNQLFHLAIHLALLAMIYFGVVIALGYRHRPLRSDPVRIEGETLRLLAFRHKGRIHDVQLEFEVPEHLRFVLRRERLFDRLAKTIGLVSETQIGDCRFDRALYLELPGSLLALRQSDPAALDWIRGLSQRIKAQRARLLELQAGHGRMKLRFLLVPPREDGREVIVSCVQWLQAPLASLRQLPPAEHLRSPWPVVNQLLGWISLFALSGGLLLMHFSHAHTIDQGKLAQWSAGLAAALTAIGLLWLNHRFDLSTTRHRLLLVACFVAWPALWGCSALLLRQVNMSLDGHAPAITALTDARLVTIARRRIQDALAVAYGAGEGRGHLLTIGPLQYFCWHSRWGAEPGAALQLQQHQGALGIAWQQVSDH